MLTTFVNTNMQLFILMLGLLGLFALVQAQDRIVDPTLPYPVEVMQYSGRIGDYDVQLNGTVQEIASQMATLYPGFEILSLPIVAPLVWSIVGETGELLTGLTNIFARAPLGGKDGIICYPVPGQPWAQCSTIPITEGVSYLQRFSTININRRTCTRISCSYSSAIYFCNDNDYSIHPTASYLASYAQDIVNRCATYNGSSRGGQGTNGIVCGQEFDSDRYNIIVRLDWYC